MAPWQVLRGSKVSRATHGYHVHHGSGGFVQYSTAAAASDNSSKSFCLSSEKFTLQQLNRRLASYLQQVQSLEAANHKLEKQIQQELDKKCPKELQQLEGYLRTVSTLQEQISERILAQAHLKLQLLTLELHSVDLKNRSEKEKERRIHLEVALEDLRLLGEELQLHKLPELWSLSDAQTQTLEVLKIQHQQDVQGLLSRVSGGVAMEMQPVQSSDLRHQLDNLRQTSIHTLDKHQNDLWLNTKVSVLTSDDVAVSDSVISVELEELRGTAASLEEELAQLHALNELLVASGRENDDSIVETLEQLQNRADGLCRDLDSVQQATARQDADHQALLGIKSRLETEIHDYKMLLDGRGCQGISKPAVTSFVPPSGVSYGKANSHLRAVQTVFGDTGELTTVISEKAIAVKSLENLSNIKSSPKAEWFPLPENDKTGTSADWTDRESMATSWSKSIVDEVKVKGQDLQNSSTSGAQICHEGQDVYQETVTERRSIIKTETTTMTTTDTQSPRSADIFPTQENITAETDREATTKIISEVIKSICDTEVKQEQDVGTELATSDLTTHTGENTVVEDTPLDPNDDSISVNNRYPAGACDALITSFSVTKSKIVRSEEDQGELLEELDMKSNKDKDQQSEWGEEREEDFNINKSQDEVLVEMNTMGEKDMVKGEEKEAESNICKSAVDQDEVFEKFKILEEMHKDQQLVKGEEIVVKSYICASEVDQDEVLDELKILEEKDKDERLVKGEETEVESNIFRCDKDQGEAYEVLSMQAEMEKDQELVKESTVGVEPAHCRSEGDRDEVYEELKIQEETDKVQHLHKGEEGEVETNTCISERETDEVLDELNKVGENEMEGEMEKGDVVDECDSPSEFESQPSEVYEELSILDEDKGQQLEKDEDVGIESDIGGSERNEDEVCVELCKPDGKDIDQQLEKSKVEVVTVGQSSSLGEVKENADTGFSMPVPLFLGPEVNDGDHVPGDLTTETLNIVEIEVNDREEVRALNSMDCLEKITDNNAEIILTEGPKQSLSRKTTETSTDSGVLMSSSDNEELLSPREADVFLSTTSPIETEVLMSIDNHQFCPINLDNNVGRPDSLMSPDNPDRYLTPNGLEKCASPNCEDEDDEACQNLTEASPASVKPVERYTLSTKEESQSLTFGEVEALPEENRNRIVTHSVSKGDGLCFGSFGSSENSGVTVTGKSTDCRPVNQVISNESGFSSGDSANENMIADKEKALGSGGLFKKGERHRDTGVRHRDHSDHSVGMISGYKNASKGNIETSLAGTCQSKRGRFGSAGSGEWIVYGGNVGRKSSSVSIPAMGSEDRPLMSQHMAKSPSGTGRFGSGRNIEWTDYGGGLGHTSASLGTKQAKAASPPGQRLGRVEGMVWMLSGSKHTKKITRSNSLHNTESDGYTAVGFPLATSEPDKGRFGRGDWRVYGRGFRRQSSLDASLSRMESKETLQLAGQLPTSPPVTPRAGRFSSSSSGEWKVYGGSTERLSRSCSSDRVSVASKAGQILSPPGSLSGPRLSSCGGSGTYSTKPGVVIRRSSSVGSGGRLSGAGSSGRLSCASGSGGNPGRFTSGSSEWKPVYSSASGRKSSAGGGARAGGGGTPRTHRAPSPGGAFGGSGGSGGWLSASTAGANRISGAGHGSKPGTEGRVITSSNCPMRSTGSGAGASKERISVCKMAALSISKAGRERSQDRQSQAQRSQQQNASALSPLIQRWLTTDVGVPSGDGNDDMTCS